VTSVENKQESKDLMVTDEWTPSPFFTEHKPVDYFMFPPAGSGHEDLKVTGADYPSIGETSAERNAPIVLLCSGDLTAGEKAVQAYKKYVTQELRKAGCTIIDETGTTDRQPINLEYRYKNSTGRFRVTTTPTSDGNLQLDVFMYEHE